MLAAVRGKVSRTFGQRNNRTVFRFIYFMHDNFFRELAVDCFPGRPPISLSRPPTVGGLTAKSGMSRPIRWPNALRHDLWLRAYIRSLSRKKSPF